MTVYIRQLIAIAYRITVCFWGSDDQVL